MSSNPVVIGALGHRWGVALRNAALSSGSATDIWADRVQSIEPQASHNTTKYYELGNVAPIGATSDPTQVRVTLEENLHNSEIDMFLAGVNPTSGSGYYAANMLGQTNTAYVLQRNDSDTIIAEIGVGGLKVSEVQYRFVNNGSCTVQYTLEGTSGSYYTSNFVHNTWGHKTLPLRAASTARTPESPSGLRVRVQRHIVCRVSPSALLTRRKWYANWVRGRSWAS